MSETVSDPPAAPLRTVSLHARVTWSVVVVLAVVLVALGVVVDSVFTAQSERNLDGLLSGRVELARQLARSGVRPQQLVNRVDANGVRAHLTLADGTELGTELPVGQRLRAVSTTLQAPGRLDGARLVLAVDTGLLDGAHLALRRVLILGGLAALAAAVLLVFLALRYALSPLDAMAALARRITSGQRGFRLRPTRPGTEIGQTATAIDAMLDELEGAERRARESEADAVGLAERTQVFLADAAHELRTPIAGIQAAAETLLHHADDLPEADRQHLEALLAAEAQRAGTLVADLLAAARLDAGVPLQPEPVDLAELVDAQTERVRLLHPALRVEADVLRGLVAAADRTALASIVRNLIDNAARAAAPDGGVRIDGWASRDGSTTGWAHLMVTDSGSGVPAQDRERIFDRLVRLDHGRSRSSGGSGLGLSIARGYARALGGDLVCTDPPQGAPGSGDVLRGACFRLWLPLSIVG